MTKILQIRSILEKSFTVSTKKLTVFYKTGVGQYAEHDKFIGVNVPTLRKIAKEFVGLAKEELQELLESKINEERLLALFILIGQYQKANSGTKEEIYNFYMLNLMHVNNWNLVDSSAHLILGAHLYNFNIDKNVLLDLAKSEIMWERRIAMVATYYFIRKNEFEWTIKIAEILLNDKHDLIHKAVGWMLREMGERDKSMLVKFLKYYAQHMPRTCLRYSIEKFPEKERKSYLMQH